MLKTSNKGNVPFALIAVTLLLTVTTYGIVAESIKETEAASERDTEFVRALSESTEETRHFVERGLGGILFDICTSDGGSYDERVRDFGERTADWLEFQFPLDSSGITARLIGHDIELSAENMNLGEDVLEGYTPTFLRATGKVKVVFESENGRTEKDIMIRTDGSCALPLVAEMGSLFENAVAGHGPLISQMINYQLTSLAQYRVLNGYGADSAYGARGTSSILTSADVEKAYRISLSALECMYFRDADGNGYFGNRDLAKDLVSDNGRIELDLNYVYAQALSSRIDDLVGKWFDYFLGNTVIDFLDSITDTIKNAWDSFTSFITGKNNFSAEPYIKEVIGNIYTGVRTGQTFTFRVTDPSTGEDAEFDVKYPRVNLYGSGIIKNFKSDYRADTNSIREWLYDVVNTAIYLIADGKGLGRISFDISETQTFADTLSDAVTKALQGNINSLENVAKESISSHRIPDQFYAAIYDAISKHRAELFTDSKSRFDSNVISQMGERVWTMLSENNPDITREESDAILRESLERDDYLETFESYRREVDDLLEKLEGLNNKYTKNSTFLQRVCTSLLTFNFFAIDYASDIKGLANAMVSEFETNMSINPRSGFTELPDSQVFTVTGESGTFRERLSVTDSSHPEIRIGSPGKGCSHETGFSESKAAGYCTVFPVTIRDSVSINVDSAGEFLWSLGMCDSVFSDRIEVNISIDVAVVSGWALSGVRYESTHNILTDLYSAAMSALEPLLEPLRELMKMAENVVDRIAQALMTINRYINELIESIYNAIMGPIERLYSLFSETITEALCDCIVALADNLEPIIDLSIVNQILGFSYMGYTLTFKLNLASLDNYTKHIVRAEFSGDVAGNEVKAFLDVKTKGETKKEVLVTGGFTVKGDDWNLSAKIDPTMKVNKHIASVSGEVKGVKIDAVLPEVVQYHEIGIRLSDFPGIGTILSNIPSPIAGTKLELDAGLELKYNVPLLTGVLVNEFESNPEGEDRNHEWAEIINLTGSTVDLNNWTLTTSKNKVHILKDLELAPGERTVVTFPGNFLLNSKEYLVLKDPDGEIADKTNTMNDSANDSRTCQRGMDGSTEWGLIEGTCGTANSGGLFGKDGMAVNIVKSIVTKAATKAMDELRLVYTVDGLQELLTRTIRYAIEDGIDRLAACVVEGSAYVSVDFADLTSSGRTGFRAYVSADSELVGDVMRYLLGKFEALFLGIDDPYNIDIESAVYDDVYIGVTVYGGISPPSLLCASTSDKKVLLGVDIRTNLSAVGGLFGCDLGTPEVKAQIGIKNCPKELIPPALGVKKNMTYDYWFIRMTFTAC